MRLREKRGKALKMLLQEESGVIEKNCNGTIIVSRKAAELLELKNPLKTMYTTETFKKESAAFHASIQLEEMREGREVCTYIFRQINTNRWLRVFLCKTSEQINLILTDITKNIEEHQLLEYERDHDSLSGLCNRNAFQREVLKHLQGERVGAMVLWDLDHLKQVNDAYGHDGGDRLIIQTAQLLAQDQGMACQVCRMAGDEFLSFYCGSSEEDIRQKITALHDCIQGKELKLQGKAIPLSISAGICWYPRQAETYEELVRYADRAMYCVKKGKRGGIGEFDLNSYEKELLQKRKKAELADVLTGSKICYVFQPIVEAATGEVFAYEALMRPLGKLLITVEDILLHARIHHQLQRIEELTWTEAICQFEEKKPPELHAKLFINSIPETHFTSELKAQLEEHHAKTLPDLVMELIETEFADEAALQDRRAFLAKWNAELAIDDFGTGYSSETRLLEVPAEYVKLDMELIHGIAKDELRQELVGNILHFVHGQGNHVIAEGVENIEDMHYLLDHEVDFMQGYYLGMPFFEPQDVNVSIKHEICSWNQRNGR